MRLYGGYIGILEKKMETTMVYSVRFFHRDYRGYIRVILG